MKTKFRQIETSIGSKAIIAKKGKEENSICDLFDLADYIRSEGLSFDLVEICQGFFSFQSLEKVCFFKKRKEVLFFKGRKWSLCSEAAFLKSENLFKCEICGEPKSGTPIFLDYLRPACAECTRGLEKCQFCDVITDANFDRYGACPKCHIKIGHCETCEESHIMPCMRELGKTLNSRSGWPQIKKIGTSKIPLYIGMELELNTSDSIETLKTIRKKYPDLFWGTFDSSVTGIELVSMPASLDYWKTVDLPFYSGCHEGGAGIHLHVCRLPHFDFQIRTILEFFFKNKNLVYAIAERKSDQYARIQGPENWENVEDLRLYNSGNKYSALNFQHKKTLEYRIFNSTLKMDHIKKDVEFVSALWEWTNKGSAVPEEEDFRNFTKSEKKTYPHLHEFLKGVNPCA